MIRLWCPLALSAILVASAGCGSHPHRGLGTEIDAPPVKRAAATLPGPLPEECRGLDIVIGTPDPRGTVDRERSAAFGAALRDALTGTGAFDRVSLVEAGVSRTARLRLDVTPSGYDLSDEPTSGETGAVIGYLFLGFWSDWFHERACRLRCAFTATLRDARTGRELARLPQLEGTAEEHLSFWERRGGGWPTLATVLYIPPMAFDTDRAKVEALLAPRAFDGPTRAIVDAIARLRVREVEATYARTFPVSGLDVEVVRPRPGPVRSFQTLAILLRGARLGSVRKVWVGGELVFDATKRTLAAGERELLLGRPVVDLASSERVLVFVELAGSVAPLAIAEVGVENARQFVIRR